MERSDSDIVFQSYGRCCNNEQFFIDFYERFMDSSVDIRELFTKTDMKVQRHLLRNGIMQLVLYARGMSDTKLRALGKSHDRNGYNIPPEWYHLWLDALIATLRQHDGDFSPEVEAAWNCALTSGINIIRQAY
ncbi:globin [Microbulbifer epialgicus]|uniref:Globin n=1 Tax=Microbulbifer epialgicus TaxID=393907 RepID=A0ABV4NUL3_9GAMM